MFITLEGIEGSGKTTQIEHLAEFLEQRGHECVVTREPGATRIGKSIRSILLDPENKNIDPLTELLLYMSDRVQHVKEVVSPALWAGRTVLCDRFYDATVVYQGHARGIGPELINTLHKMLLDGIEPDITFLLDLPPEEGLARAWKQIENGTRRNLESRFERETLRFHQKVREGYLELARKDSVRIRVINAMQSESEVRTEILKILSGLLD